MESDLGILDILLFAFIAAFLCYRLYSVLGQKHGSERKRSSHIVEKHEEVQAKKELEELGGDPEAFHEEMAKEKSKMIDLIDPNEPLSVKRGVAYVQSQDSTFDEEAFLEGAKKAFEMIVSAYSSGKISPIKSFVSETLYQAFQKNIKARKEQGDSLDIEVLKILSADLMKIEIKEDKAQIRVQFITDQKISESKKDPGSVEEITDDWVFERKLDSTSPIWTLVKM